MDAQLTLLGQFSLTVDAAPLWVETQVAHVLAALAINGSMNRDKLSNLLWPDVGRERALANLRCVLWRMPVEVRRITSTQRRILGLREGVKVDIQLLNLDEKTGPGATDAGFPLSLDQLAAPLLNGWYEEWVIAARELVRARQIKLLEHRVRTHLERSDASAAVIDATWAVTIDPLNEQAHQLLLRSHLAEGNVGEAVAHYHHLSRLLDRELGVPPFPETWNIIEGFLRLGAERAEVS